MYEKLAEIYVVTAENAHRELQILKTENNT